MAEKRLNEEQMREYVEQEVRKALMNEDIDEGIFGNLGGALAGIFPLIKKVGGIKNLSMESIAGVILGQIAIAPILTKLLAAMGIPADSKFGQFVINSAVSAGGAYLGDWIDKKWDPIGVDNGGFLGIGKGSEK